VRTPGLREAHQEERFAASTGAVAFRSCVENWRQPDLAAAALERSSAPASSSPARVTTMACLPAQAGSRDATDGCSASAFSDGALDFLSVFGSWLAWEPPANSAWAPAHRFPGVL